MVEGGEGPDGHIAPRCDHGIDAAETPQSLGNHAGSRASGAKVAPYCKHRRAKFKLARLAGTAQAFLVTTNNRNA
jgi:hypothetical protein